MSEAEELCRRALGSKRRCHAATLRREALAAAFEGLTLAEQGLVEAAADDLETSLENERGRPVGMGRVLALEVLAALGRLLNEV